MLKSVLVCLAVLYGAATAQAQAQTTIAVTDDRGRRVEFARSALRIVTLLPSLTETVCELGACERVVGTDRFSNWPQAVKDLPNFHEARARHP